MKTHETTLLNPQQRHHPGVKMLADQLSEMTQQATAVPCESASLSTERKTDTKPSIQLSV